MVEKKEFTEGKRLYANSHPREDLLTALNNSNLFLS